MKVLMYGWEFPPHISGGLGVACHAIVNELAKQNLKLTLVLPHTVNEIACDKNVSIIGCDQLKTKVDYQSLALSYGIDFKNSKYAFLHPYLNSTSYEKALLNAKQKNEIPYNKTQLTEALKNHQELISLFSSSVELTGSYGMNLLAEVFYYAVLAGTVADLVPHDVIHAHDWLTVLAGVEAKKRSNKPLVYHVHALEPDRSGTQIDQRIFAIEKYGMQQADQIAAVSQYTKKTIVEKYHISPDKIRVVYNGMYFQDANRNRINKIKKHKMVLFVGRLAHQKGPFHFVEVAQKILAKRKDVHFVIAGSGGLMSEMIRQVATLRLGRNIHFTGFLDQRRIIQIYNLADVYVMPSVSEPFGLSCLEALSHDVPVVISKQSGVAELLHHVCKVDFWDINEMANKIMALIDYRALRKESSIHTKKELKEISWKKTADTIIELYKKLLRK